MKNIAIRKQGIRGGESKYQENLGYVTVFCDNNTHVTMDNFTGFADTYAKRKETEITVVIDDVELFKGTKEELKNKFISNISDEDARDMHEELRDIISSYEGNQEYGDCIIDEITHLFGFPTTTDVDPDDEE